MSASRSNRRRTHRPSGKICTFSNLIFPLPNRVNDDNLRGRFCVVFALRRLRIPHQPLSFCDCANRSARYSCSFGDFFVRQRVGLHQQLDNFFSCFFFLVPGSLSISRTFQALTDSQRFDFFLCKGQHINHIDVGEFVISFMIDTNTLICLLDDMIQFSLWQWIRKLFVNHLQAYSRSTPVDLHQSRIGNEQHLFPTSLTICPTHLLQLFQLLQAGRKKRQAILCKRHYRPGSEFLFLSFFLFFCFLILFF